MKISFKFDKNKYEKSILATVKNIRTGDSMCRDDFIEEFKPFIIGRVSAALNNRFIDKNNSDEYSIGLIAFNEAIECFDEKKNKNFLNFAELVIYRRVINYRIKMRHENNILPFSYFENEYKKRTLNIENFMISSPNNDIKEELIIFKHRLKDFGISIMELADSAPKHRDSISLCLDIAKLISNNKLLYYKFMTRKTLPILNILKLMKINRKTIEQNRKFIIANVLILSSNLEILKEFIDNT
jgi:RNA polymerase sigma factor